MTRALRFTTVAAALAFASTASAHHSPSLFDQRAELTLTGVITTYQWRSPHLYFHLQVTDDPDAEGEWEIEAQSVRVMALVGWSQKSLAPDDRVVVVVNPARNRSKRLALGRLVSKADGTTLRIPWEREEIRKALHEESPDQPRGEPAN